MMMMRVAEVDPAALGVRQVPVLEDLEEDVEHLRDGPSRPRRAGRRSSSCGGPPRSAGRPRRSRRSREAPRRGATTLWRSMNSLMSILMSASSLPNMNSARALASSVFPTPVGPRKMNEPIGRFGSLRPARARRTALAMISIASCWPMTRSCSASSMCSSRSDSSLGDARDRDAGPHRDDLGDLLLADRRAGRRRSSPATRRAALSTFSLTVASASRSVGGLLVLLVVDRRVLLLGHAAPAPSAPRAATAGRTRGGGGRGDAASSMRSIALSGRWRSVM